MNKTLDDIWAERMYGRKTTKEHYIQFDSKNANFLERMLHPMQYGSLRGSIFGLSSMCFEAGSLVLAIRCKQFGCVNFLIAIILGGLFSAIYPIATFNASDYAGNFCLGAVDTVTDS